MEDGIGYSDYFLPCLLPTLCGKVIGRVSLVAALNYAQVVAGTGEKQQVCRRA
jgi:hypothetical protein